MPTVLIVEDDDDIREIIRVSLAVVAGWTVLSASGGHEGLELARTHVPNAVVLDMMMPDMDGMETFTHLQENSSTKHIPVVLLTAKLPAEDHSPWVGRDIRGVISKPFDPMTLGLQVARLVGWPDPS